MATRYRFGLEEYERLFRGVRNAELLEGEVYRMSPIGPKHAWSVARLSRVFTEALGDRAVVWPQNPIRIPPHSELKPDLALLRPKDYREALPTPEDVLLLVEVADASLEHDQGLKLALYAQAGIPEVWVLDLKENRLHAHRTPKAGVYTEHRVLLPGEAAEPLAFPGVRALWEG
ncbi:MAG: Uma2 family endonuclease [Thermus sp.]|uniref:Uma2 family endonuclease n=1 Tax=Thermus sp. TaxID=275 RepID=UPI00351B67EE